MGSLILWGCLYSLVTKSLVRCSGFSSSRMASTLQNDSFCLFTAVGCLGAVAIFSQTVGSYRGSYFSMNGLLIPEIATWS